MAQDNAQPPPQAPKRRRTRAKPLAPLTFEQALGVLGHTVRTPQPEITPAPVTAPPQQAKPKHHISKAKRTHKRATTTPKTKPQKGA